MNTNIDLSETNIKDIYLQYKNVLSGCRTIYDALYFSQYFIKQYPEHKNLINGMIHGKNYEKITDFRSIIHILNTLNDFTTRSEVDEYINTNIKNNFDYAQINSFIRLGRTKLDKKNKQNIEKQEEVFKLNNNIDQLISYCDENNKELSK